MKKILVIIIVLLCGNYFYAQDQLQFNSVNHEVGEKLRYKLYPTFNMWTYLKLDTQTGRVSMLLISMDDKNEGEIYIGIPMEVYTGENAVNGRYELYPTSNMWTFIMIDQINGNTYHIQWSNKDLRNNGLYKIN